MSGVSSVTAGAVPYYGQFSSAESTPAAAAPQPQDVVDIQSNLGGTFTSEASDTYSLSSLYSAAPAGAEIVGYKVALGDNSGGDGQLWLNNQNVTGQTSFTADQFSRLQYVAAASDGSQSIVVAARSGTLNADGSIANEVDSNAVQVTDNVTGTRSLNAASALLTPLTGTDANAIAVAQSAAIFTGFNGAGPPSLGTVGNITTDAGDTYSVSDLFKAASASGGVVGYRVALGDNSGDNGQLLLDGQNVTGQTLFTADQFAKLQYVAGSKGSSESLEVVARSGSLLPDGTISDEVDSPAVQITASATGTRSINAANALLTPDTGTDASEISIAQSANIFTGFGGAARPTLGTVGNITADAQDAFSVSSLFTAAPASGGPGIVGYKVALGDDSGGNGQLLLDGKDVTGQTSFTADQFANLQFVAGRSGSESLEVVAQSGTLNPDGSIANEVDSPAVQITASVTGTRSINAANALLTQPKGADAASIAIAQQASIFTGFDGAARPSLTTVGNFTAAASDVYSVNDLFNAAPATAGGDIVSYKVALGDGSGDNGQLLLDGKDVTGQTSFTADQFAGLQYRAGASGSNESLEVIAQTGTILADGSLFNEIDSPAVQINAGVTGTRSINAASALLTSLTGPDAASIAVAQSADIFGGFNGAARSSLTTVGNFTADVGDKYSLSDLYHATPAFEGGGIVGYRVALGDSSGDNGQLLLDGKDVTGQSTFTADEFADLQYVAGASGSSQTIEVVARSGTALAGGSVSNEVDSPAVQITASVTGTHSLNAASALLGQPGGPDAAAIEIAQQSSIFTGFGGVARPGLTSLADLAPAISQDAASLVLGAFQSTVPITIMSANLSGGRTGDGGSLQTGVTTQEQATAQAARLLALGQNEVGGSQSSADTSILQLYAYAAYQASGAAPGSTTSTSA